MALHQEGGHRCMAALPKCFHRERRGRSGSQSDRPILCASDIPLSNLRIERKCALVSQRGVSVCTRHGVLKKVSSRQTYVSRVRHVRSAAHVSVNGAQSLEFAFVLVSCGSSKHQDFKGLYNVIPIL